MRKLCYCLLFTFSLLYGQQNQAQQAFLVTENAGRFVRPAILDSLTRTALEKAAAEKSISKDLFTARYATYRPRIAELMKSFLLGNYIVLDKETALQHPPPGSAAFLSLQQQYLVLAEDALHRIIATPASVYPLLEADESDRILHFRAVIDVQASGELWVKETIKLFNGEGGNLSENDAIKRGIVRDFPTKYLHQNGYWIQTGFQLRSVKKEQAAVPYTVHSLNNGIRIKIGNADLLLPRGIHTYEIVYSTNQQLIFHTNRDELYWNVNGNGWEFRFDTVSARINFPQGAIIAAAECYTGARGATLQACTHGSAGTNYIEFQTNAGLNGYEGLTIAADIQKGILAPPGTMGVLLNFLWANWLVPLLVLVLAATGWYNWRSWYKNGRDPKKGIIYPQFAPPAGLGPADTGYLHQQQYGSHLFVASLVDAAVQKHLQIEVNKGSGWFSATTYQFKKPVDSPPLSSASLINLFGIDISALYGLSLQAGTYNSTLKSQYSSLETRLKNRFQLQRGKVHSTNGYFALNRGYLFLGSFLWVGALVASIIFLSLHFTPPLAIFAGISLLVLFVMQLVFYKLLPAYSEKGRQVADQIEGFRLYLNQTEQRVFDSLTPPDKTIELFERYLPYAIALNVENAWAAQFTEVLNQALKNGYQPGYYFASRGFSGNLQFSDLAKGVSAGLSNTISSSSTPPSSSSGGSRGGGSSGGGGGGGGGGW